MSPNNCQLFFTKTVTRNKILSTKFVSDGNDILVKVPIFKTNLQLLFRFLCVCCLSLLSFVPQNQNKQRFNIACKIGRFCRQYWTFACFGSVERKTVETSNKHKENGKEVVNLFWILELSQEYRCHLKRILCSKFYYVLLS